MKALRILLGWLIGLITIIWRLSCRFKHHNDPRTAYLDKREPYIVALLHAHGITGLLITDPRGIVMVSRSNDGDLIAPAVRCVGMQSVRGSSSKNGRSKGGLEALNELHRLLQEEARNPVLTVDGPRGPRNYVHGGVASLALAHQCPVIPVTAVASRTWVLTKSWDRTQIPQPLSTIHAYWGEPILPQPNESRDEFRTRIGQALRQGELTHDPDNAKVVAESEIRHI